MQPSTRDLVIAGATACGAAAIWYFGGPIWMRTFLTDRTFSGGGWPLSFLTVFYGYDFVVSFIAGATLVYFVQSKRVMQWAIGLGIVLAAAHATVSKIDFVVTPDRSDYLMVVANYLVPLVGAALGGLAGKVLRRDASDDAV